MKSKVFKNGASVHMESPAYNGMITVIARKPNGDIIDKVRCDCKRTASEYYRAFCALAKNA